MAVGHNDGGPVALELQQQHNILLSRTYGAPVLDRNQVNGVGNKADRVRHPLDPGSI